MHKQTNSSAHFQPDKLVEHIRLAAEALGFADVGIAGIDLSKEEARLLDWLDKGFHGEMAYMARHGTKRTRPQQLRPGTLSIISARMNYLPEEQNQALSLLSDPSRAYVSRYALGRDYHKLIRSRLKQLAEQIRTLLGPYGYRVFTDSAPVLEKPLAYQSGLGWVGKHSNLLCRDEGSWFFLGEIYVDIDLPRSQPRQNHCGDCSECIDACPTDAIVEPYVVDARKCISYLTIEYHGIIPEAYRKAMGNRIYGCDDCQLVCPWNRFAPKTKENDFLPRHRLDQLTLLELFSWSEQQFLDRFEGSAIRRIGYQSWMRNISIALGNAPRSEEVIKQLSAKLSDANDILRVHLDWALEQQANKAEPI